MTKPTREGFYWGQWRIKADGTCPICKTCGAPFYPGEDPDESPGMEWEVMHVVVNGNDPEDDEYLMVMVPGVGKWQPLENFKWNLKPLVRPE